MSLRHQHANCIFLAAGMTHEARTVVKVVIILVFITYVGLFLVVW